MTASSTRRLSIASLALVAALVGCSSSATDPITGTPVTDFALVDANPSSPTSGDSVSVRSFTGRASAWYFLHST